VSLRAAGPSGSYGGTRQLSVALVAPAAGELQLTLFLKEVAVAKAFNHGEPQIRVAAMRIVRALTVTNLVPGALPVFLLNVQGRSTLRWLMPQARCTLEGHLRSPASLPSWISSLGSSSGGSSGNGSGNGGSSSGGGNEGSSGGNGGSGSGIAGGSASSPPAPMTLRRALYLRALPHTLEAISAWLRKAVLIMVELHKRGFAIGDLKGGCAQALGGVPGWEGLAVDQILKH